MTTRIRREAFGDAAWQPIDTAIVRGLRRLGKAVPTTDLGETLHVGRICTEAQLRASLERLERQGLIRRLVVEVKDPSFPLLGGAFFDAYEATEVHHGGR